MPGADGPGFAGCEAVQSHKTNTRMSDPEILEKRFAVRLERFGIRPDSGGAGQWRGGRLGASPMIEGRMPRRRPRYKNRTRP